MISAAFSRLLAGPAVALALLAPSAAIADEAPPAAALRQDPAANEAPRDLSKYKEESVPGGNLMIIAYLVMWGLIGGFAVRTALRQGKLERDVAALQDRLDKGA